MFRRIIISFVIIFLFSSCDNSFLTDRIPPPSRFYFCDINPNNSDVSYKERMNKYDVILGESPIPVYVMKISDFAPMFLSSVYFEKLSSNTILGGYFYGREGDGWPNDFIYINIDLSPELILGTYYHEIGHYYDRKNKCACLKDPVLSEASALKNELEMAWEHNTPLVLKSSVYVIILYALGETENITYRQASFLVMKEDIWRKSVKYLEENEATNSLLDIIKIQR